MERKLEPQFCIHFPESRNQLSTWRGLGHVLCSGMVWSNCWLLEFGQNQQGDTIAVMLLKPLYTILGHVPGTMSFEWPPEVDSILDVNQDKQGGTSPTEGEECIETGCHVTTWDSVYAQAKEEAPLSTPSLTYKPEFLDEQKTCSGVQRLYQ
ncbi:uncharacterized protein LOC143037903 isoform X3 [Oratosquilla oratoria]|uniref:uncharacterized protein LOC143037903 isoform X3 n=1 Tax=Oratosquilla oratoria TaxID=337810 RepID=UPI003F7589E4